MIPNEEGILQDALDYFIENLDEGIYVAPESQNTEARFPCVLLSVKTSPAVTGIAQSLLAEVTVQATIFADNVYATSDGQYGVMDILDSVNEIMEAKHYRRSNNTKPSFHEPSGRWYKNCWFTKKTNTF